MYFFCIFLSKNLCMSKKSSTFAVSNKKSEIMGRHYSEGTRSHTMSLICCICHDEWIVTPEEYLFNKCGRKICDKSVHKGTTNEPYFDGWCCEKCAAEIIRIKNL